MCSLTPRPRPSSIQHGCSQQIHGETWCLRNRRLHNLLSHVWKAPTSTFHRSLVLLGMVASVSRSKGPKCARLSAASPWDTVLVSFKGPMYGKPQPVPFTRALFCQEWLHQFRDPRVQSVLDYPPPHCGPLFWFLSRDPCMESPNQYLSPEPCFARKGCIKFEIQGSKVCSTSRRLTLGHCFGFFHGTHVWKAPTSTFHQSLVLPGMVASIWRSKGPKCAQPSAPSLWATVLVSFKGPMHGKPQPIPFTRALFCQEWLHHFPDPRVQKFAQLSAPSLWATDLVSFKGPMYGKPQPVPFTRALFCQEGLHQIRDPRVQSVLN